MEGYGHGRMRVRAVARVKAWSPGPPELYSWRQSGHVPIAVGEDPDEVARELRREVGAAPRAARSAPPPDRLEGLDVKQFGPFAARRGTGALERLARVYAPDDPMAATIVRSTCRPDRPDARSALLAFWGSRNQSPVNPDRQFPWDLPIDARAGSPEYASAVDPTVDAPSWRPREADWLAREPGGYGRRLAAPIVTTDGFELLLEASVDPGMSRHPAGAARRLVDDIRPAVEGAFASCIQGTDPWADTFALWMLVEHPRAFEALHPLAFAIGLRYGTLASRTAGLVCGTRYPFADRPLVSACAHLGVGLWALGLYPTLVPDLLEHVTRTRHENGSWSDEGQPPDVLTTLAAASFLSSIDPSFDPAPTVEYLARIQEDAGWWRALGPEVPWLTAAIVSWLTTAERQFDERFRWPACQREGRDRKTGLAGFAYFSDLVRSFAELPGLSNAPIGLAFCDLASFGRFNNALGQQAGDRALRMFADELATVPGARGVRDGGDEFLVVGVPGRRGLLDDLEAMRVRWAERFTAAYPEAPRVAPRIVATATTGGRLAAAREVLGQRIGALKALAPMPDPTGILMEVACD
jgi:GGDEF domain-containing protein